MRATWLDFIILAACTFLLATEVGIFYVYVGPEVLFFEFMSLVGLTLSLFLSGIVIEEGVEYGYN